MGEESGICLAVNWYNRLRIAMDKRLIIIGDVHGCVAELGELLQRCAYQSGDQVVFVGDLVCKGPASVEVLDLVMSIGAMSVMGNHDYALVRAYEKLQRPNVEFGCEAELFDLAARLRAEHLSWLQARPYYLRFEPQQVIVVHGGLVPGVSLAQQNPEHLMRMRSLRADGSVSFRVEPSAWALQWPGPETVVFGHDAVRGLQSHEFAQGIDTGCVYGGQLTAAVFPGRELVHVQAKQVYCAVET